jgi:hypothetical protein
VKEGGNRGGNFCRRGSYCRDRRAPGNQESALFHWVFHGGTPFAQPRDSHVRPRIGGICWEFCHVVCDRCRNVPSAVADVVERVADVVDHIRRPEPGRELFSQIDGNGDGEISKSEFENALGAGGTNVAAADNVFGQLDTNGDGNVSLDELKNALEGAGGHGHHHMHASSSSSTDGSSTSTSADGSNDPLMEALAGSSTSSGSSGLTSSLVPIDQAHLMPISMSASSYSSIEAMLQSGAQAFAASAANSLSMNV